MTSFVKLPAVRKSKKGNLPNLIIIGAQKCGTTSMHYYLSYHPQITMSREKELNFFIQERNWHKGIEWYKSNFNSEAKVRGETSPNYTNFPSWSGVPERMHSVVPETRLIYIVRDPIDRIIAHYIHYYAEGLEHRKLSDALKDFNNNIYVCRSKYYMQLEQYLNYFSKSNILITTLEDLYSHRLQTLQEVFRFLDVDDSFYNRKFFKIKHKSNYKRRKNLIGLAISQIPGINIVERLPFDIREKVKTLIYFPFSHKIELPVLENNLRQELIDYLRDDINCLREFTCYNFESWCV